MRSSVASAALAAAFILTPVVAGTALAQDFSITNQVTPTNAGRRDVMRQLQAWWDTHAYYPRHASTSDEGGNVKIHLAIRSDGNIGAIDVVNTSGSRSIDTAAIAAFRGGFVRPFPEGAPDTDITLTLHYILAHRHDQPVAASYTPASSRSGFTIANDPVKSPILDTMLQRTCTGTVVKEGIRNHPIYGSHYWAQAIFFRRPDNTPWVKFYENGFSTLAPVTEIGKVVQWTGREERIKGAASKFTQYTVWPDGENNLIGNISVDITNDPDSINHGGTVDFACAADVVPAVAWSAWAVTPGQTPPGDPP